ncbi:MAG TPA: glycosyltransferase family 9 protein [Gammaproteobacteria bacterium]|nr:glycosyltransferase family 9 protein [Gammaproteobacteria bacterium]
MVLPLDSPPDSLCILRLSAVGDISHTLPIVRTLQAAWPRTRLTWIIGRTEHGLVYDIPGIEFITFDKSKRWRSYAQVRRALRGRRFDVLLHMQMSLRASIASLMVAADVRLGFDRDRAKDLQWLFTNARIAPGGRQHVIDSFFGFTEALGIAEHVLRWDIPIPDEARAFAEHELPGDQPTLVISPCSSMAYRNWNAAGYAAVADHAVERHGMRVVLSGGPSAIEAQYARDIAAAARAPLVNLIGRTDLKQLLALLTRADALIAPDAGPAHLATAVGTPVVGLYATTNPDRARPYLSAEWVINRYSEAVQAKYGKLPDELPWGTRVRDPGTMDRITPEDVIAKLDALLAQRRGDATGPG